MVWIAEAIQAICSMWCVLMAVYKESGNGLLSLTNKVYYYLLEHNKGVYYVNAGYLLSLYKRVNAGCVGVEELEQG